MHPESSDHGSRKGPHADEIRNAPNLNTSGSAAARTERHDGIVVIDEVKGSSDDLALSGHRLSSTEVTTALLSHPSVEDAAVVAVPDEERGEVLRAFVKLVKGTIPSDALKRDLTGQVLAELKTMVIIRKTGGEVPAQFPEQVATGETRNREQGNEGDDISISGRTFLSGDVEQALIEHPSVSSAVAFGVPDTACGEIIQAYVTLSAGSIPSTDLEQELVLHSQKHLGDHALFNSLEFRDHLTRNTSKSELRDILRAEILDSPVMLSITVAD